MCGVRELDPRRRVLRVMGNLSLAAGLIWWNFARPAGPYKNWLDAACGLLMGISIGANLFALRGARRCGWPALPWRRE
jgi:hypothetical protein